jgi:hypothetical protein
VLTWLRTEGPGDPPKESPEAFKKLESIPVRDRRSPEEKAKDVEDIMEWLRSPKDKEGLETAPFQKVDQLLPEKPGQNPKERAKDIDNILTWLRHDGVDLAKDDSPDAFKKIANVPMPDGRTPDENAKDIDAILE